MDKTVSENKKDENGFSGSKVKVEHQEDEDGYYVRNPTINENDHEDD